MCHYGFQKTHLKQSGYINCNHTSTFAKTVLNFLQKITNYDNFDVSSNVDLSSDEDFYIRIGEFRYEGVRYTDKQVIY